MSALYDLSFWRFVIFISFAKTWVWCHKVDDRVYVHFLNIGYFVEGRHTVFQLTIFGFRLMIGFVPSGNLTNLR